MKDRSEIVQGCIAVAINASAQFKLWNVPARGWCPARATCLGQWPSVSDWLLQLTCVAPVIIIFRDWPPVVLNHRALF